MINKTEMTNLDMAYERILKSLSSLREGTPDAAVCILMGLLLAEAELHQRIMSLFGCITRLGIRHLGHCRGCHHNSMAEERVEGDDKKHSELTLG